MEKLFEESHYSFLNEGAVWLGVTCCCHACNISVAEVAPDDAESIESLRRLAWTRFLGTAVRKGCNHHGARFTQSGYLTSKPWIPWNRRVEEWNRLYLGSSTAPPVDPSVDRIAWPVPERRFEFWVEPPNLDGQRIVDAIKMIQANLGKNLWIREYLGAPNEPSEEFTEEPPILYDRKATDRLLSSPQSAQHSHATDFVDPSNPGGPSDEITPAEIVPLPYTHDHGWKDIFIPARSACIFVDGVEMETVQLSPDTDLVVLEKEEESKRQQRRQRPHPAPLIEFGFEKIREPEDE